MDKTVGVDISNLVVIVEEAGSSYKLFGEKALTLRITNQEVLPPCHPLGWKNKLIFALGPLSGTAIPTSGRMSVSGKCPFTHAIMEANARGTFGDLLARKRIKAIVVETKLPENKSEVPENESL